LLVDAADQNVAQAVGHEFKRVRYEAKLTREQVVERLPFPLHVQTIAAYERGTIQLTVPRFVALCRPVAAAAPDVLSLALQRVQIDLRTNGLHVDLHTVLREETPKPELLHRWAHNRLTNPDTDPSGIAHLSWEGIQELAAVIGITPDVLAARLVKFTPHTHSNNHGSNAGG
jgi:hypothetical protein